MEKHSIKTVQLQISSSCMCGFLRCVLLGIRFEQVYCNEPSWDYTVACRYSQPAIRAVKQQMIC